MKIYLKEFLLGQVTLIFALACFALSPQARAVCQDTCLTDGNTVQGDDALISLTTDFDNVAYGAFALYSNTTGSENIAVGHAALTNNRSGYFNTAVGDSALVLNIKGNNNTAIGAAALSDCTSGTNNTATGFSALFSNDAGKRNTANGAFALFNNTTGSGNIALGYHAGFGLFTGSRNIDIGNEGVAEESNTICIGTEGTHTDTFIAGISGATVPDGVGVIVGTDGKLGTVVSSERFKDAIKPMDKASEVILALKPVTFHYNKELDPDGIPQFGLVAEQVEKVNPDLVARDDQGKAYTVRYEAVNAMLLNEFLKEHAKVEQLKKDFESKIAQQQKQIELLTAGLQKVSAQIELSKPVPQIVLNNQ
jgi:hypothetical protein